MTGDIKMTDGEYINASNGYAMCGQNGSGTFFSGPGYAVSTSFLLRSANINLTHRKHTSNSSYTDYIIYDSSNLTQSVITTLIGSTTYAPYVVGGYLPLSGGTMTGSPILTNGIYLRSLDSGGTSRTIMGINSSNQVLIAYGTSSQGYETVIHGGSITIKYGTSRTTGLTIDSSGIIHATKGFYSDSYVSAGGVSSSSDARLKTDLKDIGLTVDQIAEAPAVTFRWKNETTSPRHAGSIAQYWETVLPETVSEIANHLALDYGATALLSAITVAKEVQRLRDRIKELEEKVYALE